MFSTCRNCFEAPSPGQTLFTPVPVDHVFLSTFPIRPPRLHTSMCIFLPRCRLKKTLSRTTAAQEQLHERPATCDCNLPTWPSFATAAWQIGVVAFRPAMHISPTKTFPRLAQESRPWTTPRNVRNLVIRTLAYFRPCLG
jgi:hypothetical protein